MFTRGCNSIRLHTRSVTSRRNRPGRDRSTGPFDPIDDGDERVRRRSVARRKRRDVSGRLVGTGARNASAWQRRSPTEFVPTRRHDARTGRKRLRKRGAVRWTVPEDRFCIPTTVFGRWPTRRVGSSIASTVPNARSWFSTGPRPTGSGTLRSSFQRLSRIEDERGTREGYEGVHPRVRRPSGVPIPPT